MENRSASENTDLPAMSDGESHCQNYRPTRCCKSCSHITDSSHWVLMEPSVSMESKVEVYKHSSPSGSFECAVSGLRWVCAGEVTLQYHFCDTYVFTADLAMLQYTTMGPLMDIKVLSGELLEAHLPHFACLEGSDSSLSDAVRVVSGVDDNLILETGELTRFHVKLLKPSLSLTEVVVKTDIQIKTHLEVLIYRTRVRPLVLFTYLVPWSGSMMQTVKDDLRQLNVRKIEKPQPEISLWVDSKFSLKTSCHSEINPHEYTLNLVRPNFFEVYMKEPEDCFDLELISGGQSIWKAEVRRADYGEVKRVVTYTPSKTPSLDEGRMANLSNRERLSFFRPDLITRTSRGAFLDEMEALAKHQPPVLNSYETKHLLENVSGLEEQVTCLLDMVDRKGNIASGIMFVVLKEKDFYLYEDILLNLQANLPENAN
ncbi:NACHT, LRR and PYD domains-containing protein 1 homolog isoform X3 [Alosa sapidissima]|uniref:NACHT, LRR and PYD domains-containing protein 1 homolog isoform X3 n=1 Tax=Alosa sapidissima TaxID=34773 RepID=UPI001C08286A|nr:NACHT, LRR and PYD domains-containing protein 1 homolog isoform X3 [Alosa sapidissima]